MYSRSSGLWPNSWTDLVALLDELGHQVGVGLLQDLDGNGAALRVASPKDLRHTAPSDEGFQVVVAELLACHVDRGADGNLAGDGPASGRGGVGQLKGKLRLPDLDAVAGRQDVAEDPLLIEPRAVDAVTVVEDILAILYRDGGVEARDHQLVEEDDVVI